MSEVNQGTYNNFFSVSSSEKNELIEQEIICIDCKNHFVWAIGEQIFFRDKGLTNPPKRCKECKQAKNERLAAIAASQAAGIKQKIEVAVNCASCGETTTVPFYPSQGRPVFCRSCYLKMNPSLIGGNAADNKP